MRMPSRSLSSRTSGDVFDFFVVDELSDAFDEDGLVYLVGNFGDDDGLFIFGDVFDGGFGAHQ